MKMMKRFLFLVVFSIGAINFLHADILGDVTGLPKDVANLKKKKEEGTLGVADVGVLNPFLKLIPQKTLGNDIIGVKTPKFLSLPREMNSKEGLAIEGSVLFNGKSVNCRIIAGNVKDPVTGTTAAGYSFALSLPDDFKVSDLKFLGEIPGMSKDTLNYVGSIDLPSGMIIFSSFDYTDPQLKMQVRAGITLTSKTRVGSLLGKVRQQINKVTNGAADKLPFIANVKDDQPIIFNLALGFKGTNFDRAAIELILPMEFGLDFAKLRNLESQFNPKIGKPFAGLNKTIKDVTSVLNKSPLNAIKEATFGNFIAALSVDTKGASVAFAAELNVIANNGDQYGMRGAVALTTDSLLFELRKMPGIPPMNLGSGVYIKDLAVSTSTSFALLASTGSPLSGLGLLGSIEFPIDSDQVTITLGGKFDIGTSNLLMMGSLQNLNATRVAQFSANMIQSVGKKVGFDSSQLTKAMSQMPKIVVKDARLYFASAPMELAGVKYPMGFGAGMSIDVFVDKIKYSGSMSMAGSDKELSAEGILSPIKTSDIVITGPGKDGKYGTDDDGLISSFKITSNVIDSNFKVAGRVALPTINIQGDGDLFFGATRISGDFSASIQDLFKAKFNINFNPMDIRNMDLGFGVESGQSEKLMGVIYQGLEAAAAEKRDLLANVSNQLSDKLSEAQKKLDASDYKATQEFNATAASWNADVDTCANWVGRALAFKTDPLDPPAACKRVFDDIPKLLIKGVSALTKKTVKELSQTANSALNELNKVNDKLNITSSAQQGVQDGLNEIVKAMKKVSPVPPKSVSASIKMKSMSPSASLTILGASITLPAPIGKVTFDIKDFVIDMNDPKKSFESIGLFILNNIIIPRASFAPLMAILESIGIKI